jgi:hypothetical protein
VYIIGFRTGVTTHLMKVEHLLRRRIAFMRALMRTLNVTGVACEQVISLALLGDWTIITLGTNGSEGRKVGAGR